jgi:hypothetical protein
VRSIALVQPLIAARVEEIEQDADAGALAAALEAQVSAALRAQLHARPDAIAPVEAIAPTARAAGDR